MAAKQESDHYLLEPLNHPPQTPLQPFEIEELAKHLALDAINYCRPNGDIYTHREFGNMENITAMVDIFKLSTFTNVPATVEIATQDTYARTAMDDKGQIHAIFSRKSGPYFDDSIEARDAIIALAAKVFSGTNPQ